MISLCVAPKPYKKPLRTHQGVEIRLNKRIPAGAGLGGGSSDAATTLHALNRLWKLSFDVDQLAAIGLTLGADVPVFVRGFTAFAEGIGERLQPVSLEQYWYLADYARCACFNSGNIRRPGFDTG